MDPTKQGTPDNLPQMQEPLLGPRTQRESEEGLGVGVRSNAQKTTAGRPDEGWLEWYAINKVINGLGGSWIAGNRFDKAHWRVPK